MTITDIENAIIERLKSKITKLHIQGFTQKSAEFAMKHPAGAILVTYKGSKYKEPRPIGVICQERKIRFGVFLLFKNLKVQDNGYSGAYEYLDLIRILLTGFRPPDCSKMYPVDEEFLDEESGMWQYGILCEMSTENIEDIGDEAEILLKKITTLDHFNEEIHITEKQEK